MSAHVDDRIEAFLDHELGEPEAATVREHCLACEPCQRALEESLLLRRLLSADAAVVFQRPLVAQQISETGLRVRSFRRQLITAAAMTGSLLAGISLGVHIGTPKGASPAVTEPGPWFPIESTVAREGAGLQSVYLSSPPVEGAPVP